MPKIVTFNGKRIVEPGAYSRIVGGESNPPDQASFGKVLIIDTGSMAGYGFGPGINAAGTTNKADAIQEFTQLSSFRNAVSGSVIWDVAKWLFKPSKDLTVRGVESIVLVHARTTTQAKMSYTWTGGGAAGGVFEVVVKVVEGLAANGVENATSNKIERGFGMRMVAGTLDPDKFAIEFYRGTFKGLDVNSIPFDNISADKVNPELIVKSAEFDNIAQLVAWANTNQTFQSWFSVGALTETTGTGVVDSDDLDGSSGNELAAGATETYGAGDLADVFEYIAELDYTYILLDNYEANMLSTPNLSIYGHVKSDSEFDRIMVIGGGAGETNFAASINAAETFDDQLVHIVHSRVKDFTTAVMGGVRTYPSIYHAAAYLGLIAGNPAQEPATFKNLAFGAPVHEMKKSQREEALIKGVVHQRFVQDLGWVVNQDVNTLQKNELDVYEDGTSPHGSIVRIATLLNKELVTNLRKTFTGKNINNANPVDVKAFVEGYLGSRTAIATDDNLILSFKNVRVSVEGSDYEVQYGFTPNGPANRFFVTGFMFSPELNA